jgi:hypothetical protein
MLSLVIFATSLWVCPGDVYTDQPREGCKPFRQSTREGFSTIQGVPPDPGESAPARPASPPVIYEQGGSRPSASPTECALYDEWLALSTKSRGGIGAHDLTPQEFERWSLLRNMFSVTAPPVCSPSPDR